MTLVDRLLEWERRAPDKVWLVDHAEAGNETFTYREAAERIRRMAAAIRTWELPRGSRIGISGRNTAHWFMADLAITMAGHISVGFYPRQGKVSMEYILEHAEISHLFLGPSLMEGDAEAFAAALPPSVHTVALPYDGVPRASMDFHAFLALANGASLDDAPPPADGDAMLIYTSGTSGNPKGVILTHANIEWSVDNILKANDPPVEHEVFFSYLPLAHLMERIFGEAMSLHIGAEVHFIEKAESLAQTLAKVSPTRFAGVPLVYSRIQGQILSKLPQKRLDFLLSIPGLDRFLRYRIRKRMGLSRVAAAGVGGAPMPKAQINWFESLGIPICQGYGMTETAAYAAAESPSDRRPGSVGRPLPGSGFRLSDEGEIQFKHAGLMKGYFKDPEATASAFTEDGWLKTGDRGRVDLEGYLYITGRIKEEFKTGKGKYVAPAPIEAKMAGNADLEQMCLVGVGLNQPVLLATLSAAAENKSKDAIERDLEAVMQEVNLGLAEHERIAQCVVVRDEWTPDNGFVTPTGKVRRSTVESAYGEFVLRCAADRSAKVKWAPRSP